MKRWLALILTLLCAAGLMGCDRKSMNYIIGNKPSVTGVVEEVYDDFVILWTEDAEGYLNGSRWSVPLDVENKDSYTDLSVGDEIVVYHDGNIMESDPLKVGKVYAIVLKKPVDRAKNEIP